MTSFIYWCAFIRTLNRLKMAQRGEELNDDVPPLEDMSEYLEKAKELKSKLQNPKTFSEIPAPKQSCVTKQNGTAPADSSSNTKGVGVQKDATASTFGGLKKGFLFGSTEKQGGKKPTQKTEGKKLAATVTKTGVASSKHTGEGTASSSDDIPFIKPQGGTTSKGLEFPEVQEAMKESYPLLRSQNWVTDDLLTKIGEHPLLSRAFQDPRLAQVISQFQSNPQAVMAATRDNPELRTFLQEFCALMGEHFTALADKEEKEDSSRRTPLISEAATSAAEEVRMRELLQRPAVQEALADPRIQELIATLRSNPDKGQQILRSSSSQELQDKVKVLIDNGLLAVQRL